MTANLRLPVLCVLIAVGLIGILALSAMAHTVGAGTTTVVSVASDGTPGNNSSSDPYISANGRYVAFVSRASNLVPGGDTNLGNDGFVHDRLTGETTLEALAWDGQQPQGSVFSILISSDGKSVVFWTTATNVIVGGTPSQNAIYLRDRATGAVTPISVNSAGDLANGASSLASISQDARVIGFSSEADNLVSGDNNGSLDGFVHEVDSGITSRVTVASDGSEGNGTSYITDLSLDGRYVVLASSADNLVPGDTNNVSDIFVHDRQTGQTTRVSIASDGTEADGPSNRGQISADGRWVSIESEATNLVAGDTNGERDFFIHDRQSGETTRVSVATDGTQADGPSLWGHSLSDDGRYISFESAATNLVPGDTNGFADIFMHDRVTGVTYRISIASDGTQANRPSFKSSLPANGEVVAFFSTANNLVPNDGTSSDVFVHEPNPPAPPHPPLYVPMLTN